MATAVFPGSPLEYSNYHRPSYEKENFYFLPPQVLNKYHPHEIEPYNYHAYHPSGEIVKFTAPVATKLVAPVLAKVTTKTVGEETSAPAHYSYGYSVSDPHTGDVKTQHEERKGDAVHGSYSLIDADGTKRIVEYTADAQNGFNAVVRKEPVAAKASVAKVLNPIAKYLEPSAKYVVPSVKYVEPLAKYVEPVDKVTTHVAKVASPNYVDSDESGLGKYATHGLKYTSSGYTGFEVPLKKYLGYSDLYSYDESKFYQ